MGQYNEMDEWTWHRNNPDANRLTIPSEEQTRLENRRRAVARAIVSICFEACQPNRGDVFGWIDDNADKIAAFIVEELKL